VVDLLEQRCRPRGGAQGPAPGAEQAQDQDVGSGVAGPSQSDAAPPRASAVPAIISGRRGPRVPTRRPVRGENSTTSTPIGSRHSPAVRAGELQENLQLIDHKIDVYRGRVDAGDADRLWAPSR
jgi:hypothetical protein